MGARFFDKYTYLHFGTGIVIYYWGVSLMWWLLLHTLFELVENTPQGVHFIDNYLKIWPGGKLKPDSLTNSLGDTVGAILGWLSAHYVKLI
jgi:hypothetical protein